MKVKVVILSLALCHVLLASDHFDSLTNSWFCGAQSNVNDRAGMRLSSVTNDFAALIIKASWDFSFSPAVELSNSLHRVMSVASSITNVHFKAECNDMLYDMQYTLDHIRNETEAQRQKDLIKVRRNGLMPHYVDILKALDDDHLLDWY